MQDKGMHIVDMEERKMRLRLMRGAKRKRLSRGNLLARAQRRYRAWLNAGEEPVRYKSHFAIQLCACLLILCAMLALKDVQNEQVQSAMAAVKSVATADVDILDSVGKLEFVGNFLPESVMVFWNGSARTQSLAPPLAESTLLLENEKGALFEGTGDVLAGGRGTVLSVEQTTDGAYRATLDYGDGLIATYEPLTGVRVAGGDSISKDQAFAVPEKRAGVSQIKVRVTRENELLSIKDWMQP